MVLSRAISPAPEATLIETSKEALEKIMDCILMVSLDSL